MLNDAAKKMVARSARVEAKERRASYHQFAANIDTLVQDAWTAAQQSNPDFRNWPSAQGYFDAIFCNEIEREY